MVPHAGAQLVQPATQKMVEHVRAVCADPGAEAAAMQGIERLLRLLADAAAGLEPHTSPGSPAALSAEAISMSEDPPAAAGPRAASEGAGNQPASASSSTGQGHEAADAAPAGSSGTGRQQANAGVAPAGSGSAGQLQAQQAVVEPLVQALWALLGEKAQQAPAAAAQLLADVQQQHPSGGLCDVRAASFVR